MRRTPAATALSPVTRDQADLAGPPDMGAAAELDRPRAVRNCPPAPSPIETTRTSSPYFSPNSAMAPDSIAESRSISRVVTGASWTTTWLASASTLSISSASSGFGCEKSKRSRSGATSEPFCATCEPSTPRSAA